MGVLRELRDRQNIEAIDRGEVFRKAVCRFCGGRSASAILSGDGRNQFMRFGLRPCVCEESLLITFRISGNTGFEICLPAVFQVVCTVSSLYIGRVVLGRGKSNVISIEGTFSLECSSYVSLEPSGSQGDICCLSWDVTEVNVQDVVLDDTPECRRVIFCHPETSQGRSRSPGPS